MTDVHPEPHHPEHGVTWLEPVPASGLDRRGLLRGRHRRGRPREPRDDEGTGTVPRQTDGWERPDGPPPMTEWLNDNLLLVGGDDGPTAAIAAHLPAEPDVVTVIGVLSRVEDWWWLAEAVAFAVPVGTAVRLAVSYAGQQQAGRMAPAARLARQLRVDVLAPDGPLVLTPTGTAFVAVAPGGTDAAVGRWLRFRPDGTVEPSGPRYPVPEWAAGVDRIAGTVGSLRVTPIPCGLWVHQPAQDVDLADGLVYAAPADAREVLMVVGAAGTEPPTPAAVADVADELPASLAGRLVLVPHAGGADRVLPTARELARRWRREVAVSTGLPVVAADGSRSVVATKDSGDPQWRPLVPRLRVPADGEPPGFEPRPGDPALLSGVPRIEAGVYVLSGAWVAQVFWAGLWVRHGDRPGEPPPLADTEWDPRWLTVLVDSDVPEQALENLAICLPADARGRVRLQRTSPEAPP